MRKIIITLMSIASLSVFAEQETKSAKLVSFVGGVATYSIEVCSESDSSVYADIEFKEVAQELVYANLKIFVDGDRGFCAGGRKSLEVNIEQLIKAKTKEKGIRNLSILLKNLPTRLEIINK